METLWQDIRYGLRALMKSPGFTAVVVLTLSLGIGANTAIFSVVNSLLLRPLPVRNPQDLAVIAISHEGNEDPHPVSYLDYLDYRAQSDAFTDVAGYDTGLLGLSAENRAERVTLAFVTGNYFSLLGVEANRGRVILPAEGQKAGADPVLVLGYGFWQRRFGGDPRAIGQVVKINGQPFTIVGVAPPEFHGTYALLDFDGYVPLGMIGLDTSYPPVLEQRDAHNVHLLGRLKPGVSIRQAQASLDVVAKRLEQQYPETNKTVKAHVFPENLARPEPSAANTNPLVASIFLLLTGLVLLVACVNVANLLLARSTVRQKEIAIRAALGAGTPRLMRQLLTESLLLAALGAAAGLVVGLWVSRALGSLRLPGDLPFRFDFSFDWRVFAFVAGVALLTGLVVGLLPAFRATRVNLNESLREGGRGGTGGIERHRARNALVVAQVAGSLVVLVTAGLFVRSLANARSVDFGFDPHNVLNVTMDPAQLGYDEVRGRAFYRELEERVGRLPGVESVSLAHSVPLGYYSQAEYVEAEGQNLAVDDRRPIAGCNMVSLDYFKTMRIPLVRGRTFAPEDNQGSRPVAVVNEVMARRFWPDQDPIGNRFSYRGPKGPWVEVVGVSRTGKYGWIFADPVPYFFLPSEQAYQSLRVLQVRTEVPPESLLLAVQQEIRTLEADLPVTDAMTMEQAMEGANGFFLIRMGALLAGALGLLGLSLAVVGVYGVVSYAASQRTHEVGIRMALGAQPGDILRLVMKQGLALVIGGVALGLVGSIGLGRLLSRFLFGLSGQDPMTFLGVSAMLGLVAVVACWIPARRATRVDPMVALRYE